jgi:hypothetical protein
VATEEESFDTFSLTYFHSPEKKGKIKKQRRRRKAL